MLFPKLFRLALAGLAVSAANAQAALPAYGYVTGTFVAGSNYLEPLDVQGKFLHYHFKVQTAPGVQYEAVIDVKNGHLYPFPQRVVTINSPGLYGPVFSSTNGYHPITITFNGGNAAQGAIDYMRHPGILSDMRAPWSYIKATPTANSNIYTLPQWDALFSGVQKIYVFGEPYSVGTGVHVVHQNQGDKKSSFYPSNALYQDGAVVFEYAGGVRKILLTRFDDQPNDVGQSDFSWDGDPDGAGPLKVGAARAPIVVQSECGGSSAAVSGFEQCVFGPFAATQIEAETLAPGAYPVPVYLYANEDGAMSSMLVASMEGDARHSQRHEGEAQVQSIAIASSKGYRRAYTPASPAIPSYYVHVPYPMNGTVTQVTIRYVP
jgi:hypothetical protein